MWQDIKKWIVPAVALVNAIISPLVVNTAQTQSLNEYSADGGGTALRQTSDYKLSNFQLAAIPAAATVEEMKGVFVTIDNENTESNEIFVDEMGNPIQSNLNRLSDDGVNYTFSEDNGVTYFHAAQGELTEKGYVEAEAVKKEMSSGDEIAKSKSVEKETVSEQAVVVDNVEAKASQSDRFSEYGIS